MKILRPLLAIILSLAFMFLLTYCRHEAIIPDAEYYKSLCDSTNITYDNYVRNYMIDKSCVLCHTDEMGFLPYLDVHDSIRNYVSDSIAAKLFMEKIMSNHQIVDTAKFNTSCDISKLRNWINMGAY